MLVVFRPRTRSKPPREQTDSHPLRRSARLIAKQQRLKESRSSKEDPSPDPHFNRGCSTRARNSQSSLDCSVKEVVLKEPPHTSEIESTHTKEKGSRKRKRSNSPKRSSVSQPPELPSTRLGVSHNTPFTRPTHRRRSARRSLEPSQTTVETDINSATNISEGDSKTKSSAKRRRTSRGTATDTSSRLSTPSGKNPSHNRGVAQLEKQEVTTHSRGSGKSQRGSSSDRHTKKGKTKKSQPSSSVEELDESTKKTKRRKEQGKGSVVETEGGEFDPHGRRAVRESVIRDPTILKGKGQTTSEKSSKGKGRARTESLRYKFKSKPLGCRLTRC